MSDLKKQREHYSGKKKRHTQKAQLAIDASARRVLATAFGRGAMHDFALYKQTPLPLQKELTCCKADSGYLGIRNLHANAQVPKKSSKHHPLTPEQKASNHQLSSERMLIEHVIGWIKRFRILAERYRNRRRRFALRFNLIAAIYNKEMAQ